jgi:adenylate cyclase, class 2
MQEIEVKILDINLEEIRKKLLVLGAEKVFDGKIHAMAFDFPDMRLDKEDSFIRVRKVGEQIELCFKGKKEEKSKFKIREEIEVNVSAFKDTIEILEKIGLKKYNEGKKNRESYKLNNVRFEIDSWGNIPHFIEIEAKTEEEIEKNVKMLGYTMEQTNTWTYLDIERHYNARNRS